MVRNGREVGEGEREKGNKRGQGKNNIFPPNNSSNVIQPIVEQKDSFELD